MIFARKNKTIQPAETDVIPDKIARRLHMIYFIVKWIMIGTVLFLAFGFIHMAVCWVLGVSDLNEIRDQSGTLRHEYCGTFFVELTADNSFSSREAYDAYCEEQASAGETPVSPVQIAVRCAGGVMLITLLILHLIRKKPKFLRNRFIMLGAVFVSFCLLTAELMGGMSLMLFLLLLLALRSGDRKTLFSNRASDYFWLSGLLWLVGNLVNEVLVIGKLPSCGEGLTGIFAHPVYYPMLYTLTAVPVITICCGLMLRQHELNLQNRSTAVNSRLLKALGIAVLAGGGAFLCCRLGVRVYELIRVMTGDAYSVSLPFTVMDNPYNKLIELPYELAKTPQDYQNVILFRFVKDFPVFVLSALAMICFVKVLFRTAKGEINSKRSRRSLNIAMLGLVGASLWFNLMGIWEIELFNSGFTGIYGHVTYTIALRSLTEPAIYAMVLWFFKTYLQAVPEKQENEGAAVSITPDFSVVS